MNYYIGSSIKFSTAELAFGQKLVNPIDFVISTRV